MGIIKLLKCCVFFFTLCACHVSEGYVLTGKVITDTSVSDYRLTLQGVDTVLQIVPDAGKMFRVSLPSGVPFFNLEGSVMKENRTPWQFSTPVYLEEGKVLNLELKLEDGKETMTWNDETNRVIQQLRLYQNQKFEDLWEKSLTRNELEAWLANYREEVKKIADGGVHDLVVKEFITSWTAMEYLKLFKGVQYIFPNDDHYQMPQALLDTRPDLAEVADKPYWILFPNCDMNIMFYLQDRAKEPEEQLRLLNENFKDSTIREKISNQVVANFVKYSPYSVENLERVRNLCARVKNGDELVQQFRGKEFSTVGASCPDVAFLDVDGKEHHLTEFKGKYVYMDIWASWCAPCCAEVPALQRLEKELNNPNVVFLSISVDKNKKQWQEKMKELNMEGNQWIISGDDFTKMLNIKSIPHFLLYDKNGKLMDYRMPRPSQSLLRMRLQRLN